MADDMEDIEDMLEAPYKNIASNVKEHKERKRHVIISYFYDLKTHLLLKRF
jgi:hypothetical protein